jgi:hypothetical protein
MAGIAILTEEIRKGVRNEVSIATRRMARWFLLVF